MWLELLIYYDMSIVYHLGKANVVADTLSKLSKGNSAYVEEQNKILQRCKHICTIGIRFSDSNECGGVVMNWVESSVVSKVKEKQD